MKPFFIIHGQRLAALLILIFLCSVLYLVLIGPIFTHYAEAVRNLEADRALLLRYERIASSAPDVADLARSVRARQIQSGIFVSGSTDALAAANLQNSIGTLVTRAGGELRSVQSLPVENSDGLRRIKIRFQLITNVHGLRQILHELETGQPLLFIDEFKVRTRLERISVQSDELEVAQDFLVDMAISGYRLGESA